jgi:tetratricopeptide (TPR) repeat protein
VSSRRALCPQFRKAVTAFLEAELAPLRAEAMRAHLRSCAPCAAVVEQHQRLIGLLRGLGTEPPAAATRQRLLALLAQAPRGRAAAASRARGSKGPRSRIAARRTALLRRLLALPEPERVPAIHARRSLQAPWLAEQLLVKSYARRFVNPRETLELAQLAREVTRLLRPRQLPAPRLQDLCGRVTYHVASAHRILGRLAEAEELFAAAAAHLRAGSGDRLLQAEWLERLSELRYVQRRHAESIQCCDAAVRLFDRPAERSRRASCLIVKALALERWGKVQDSLAVFEEALELLEKRKHLRLYVLARHNQASALIAAGRLDDAQRVVDELGPIYHHVARTGVFPLRVKWLHGQIAGGLGRYAEAEATFRELREAFLAEGNPLEVALASLELAVILAQTGRLQELKAVAAETAALYAGLGIQREYVGALALLQQATAADAATAGLVRGLLTQLARSR